MHSKTQTKAKIIGLGLIAGLMSAAVMAEPPIQPGDTLESLSKVKINTTVNGQPGSIQELVASGQVRIVEAPAQQQAGIAAGEPAPESVQPLDTAQADLAQANQVAVEQAPVTSNDALGSSPAESVTNAGMDQTGADQANLAAAQDAQSTLNQEQSAAQVQAPEIAPAHAAEGNPAPALASSANAPVNAEAPDSDSILSAAPDAPETDQAVQAAPEMPMADSAIQASPELPEASADPAAQ